MGVDYKYPRTTPTPRWSGNKPKAWSWLFGILVASGIYLITPLCWGIAIDAAITLSRGSPLSASLWARSIKSPWIRKIFWTYATIEVPFSIWYQLASYRVQRRVRHKPIDRALLRQLMLQCCAVGTEHFDQPAQVAAKADALDQAAGISPQTPIVGHNGTAAAAAAAQSQNKPSMRRAPPLFPAGTRFDQTTEEQAARLRARFSNWFFCSSMDEVQRGNILEWLAWALLESKVEEIERDEEAMELLNDCIDAMETRLRWNFPAGKNKAVTCVRLSIDPVRVMSRPLGFYLLTNTYTFLVEQFIRRVHGVQKLRFGRTDFLIVPPKPRAPGDDPEALPILFLHGLGIGIGQYRFFLRHLVRHKPGAIIVVQPHISAQLFDANFLRPPLRDELTRDVRACIEATRIGYPPSTSPSASPSYTIISHSNGSMVHGWMLRAMPGWFKRNVLVDPVCFRMWEGAVCNAFVYRSWSSAIEVLLGYIVSREIGVAWTIGRFFRWTDMTLWAHEFEAASDDHVHVVLAEQDMLVDVPGAVDYLSNSGVPHTVMKGYQHGQPLCVESEGLQTVLRHAKIKSAI
ncbi:hypothetical protein OC834_007669 [Tilletia horrida]|uniref:AB hydrolase-1 domain-containing protein n=1 Tax=Tilletia horrida TaxID=155126 RepID=A0AAN6GFU5_9BASI|nr:hypothetical protein OC834_007669 [Tilletia horrida]KAK0531470.1 hypothetical protein OC842_003612 [Tilletia horrida]